jgi:Na+-driven multidrug efflux pump
MVVAVTVVGIVVLTAFGLFVLFALFTAGRLLWRLMQGDEQIESTSWGRQYLRRKPPEG